LEEVEGSFSREYTVLWREYDGSFEEKYGSRAEMWVDSAPKALRQQDAPGPVIPQTLSRCNKSTRNFAFLVFGSEVLF